MTTVHSISMPRAESNPRHRFRAQHLERDADAPPELADLIVHEERARSIVSTNESPDLGFRHSVNPYRGCFHACAYCYARPSHTYLDLGAGTDFDRVIVAKTNAVDLLRDTFDSRSWRGETIVFSGNTDCYQPIESRYQLTRRLLELCLEYRNPVAIITKSQLVRRDVELLAALVRDARCLVTVSCAFDDDEDARLVEPYAPPPSKRFETMRLLAEAGIPVAISLAPTIPGVNDSQIPAVLERARDAGVRSAFHSMVRLSSEVREVFSERITEAYPLRAQKILSGIREMRGGAMNRSGFGERMRGEGPRWDAIASLFALHSRRMGLDGHRFTWDDEPSSFRRPTPQLDLF